MSTPSRPEHPRSNTKSYTSSLATAGIVIGVLVIALLGIRLVLRWYDGVLTYDDLAFLTVGGAVAYLCWTGSIVDKHLSSYAAERGKLAATLDDIEISRIVKRMEKSVDASLETFRITISDEIHYRQLEVAQKRALYQDIVKSLTARGIANHHGIRAKQQLEAAKGNEAKEKWETRVAQYRQDYHAAGVAFLTAYDQLPTLRGTEKVITALQDISKLFGRNIPPEQVIDDFQPPGPNAIFEDQDQYRVAEAALFSAINEDLKFNLFVPQSNFQE
jgi:hypothetical protein